MTGPNVTKPHARLCKWCARSEKKNSSTIRIHILHFPLESSICVSLQQMIVGLPANWHPHRCRTLWVCLTKSHGTTNGAYDPNEKIPEPYVQFYIFPLNQPFVEVRPRKQVAYLPTVILTAAIPYESTPTSIHIHAVLGQNLRIHLPYNMHGVTSLVYVQCEQEPYRTNGDTFNTNPLRVMRTTLRTIQYHRHKTYCF